MTSGHHWPLCGHDHHSGEHFRSKGRPAIAVSAAQWRASSSSTRMVVAPGVRLAHGAAHTRVNLDLRGNLNLDRNPRGCMLYMSYI